mgnify:CR=1 FL=1
MSRKTRPATQTDANFRPIQDSELWTTFRGDYTGTNLIYAGSARPGASTAEAVWQIRRMTYDASNNITAIEWPVNSDGAVSADFEFIWNNRAALTYA